MPRLTKLQREHNQERVDRASEIIEDYKSRVTGEDAATYAATYLRDVLADLMHFARASRLNFDGELATARNYFDDELNGLMRSPAWVEGGSMICCPQCRGKNGETFIRAALSDLQVFPDGTEPLGCHEYTDDNDADCTCGWRGKVRDMIDVDEEES